MLKTDQLTFVINGQPLFQGINISLDSHSGKKVALVGKNGCGKSTLLKIFNRELKPTRGSLSLANESIGYLPQEINFFSRELVGEYLEKKLAEQWLEYKIDTALAGVGLPDEYLIKEMMNLSGGEKVKVFLAGLLLDDPTILMLDEPTNNLDDEGVEWLEKFVRNFKGSAIIVSHDRYLINRTVQKIWEIDPDTLDISVFAGNYDVFLAEKKRLYEKRTIEYNSETREIQEIEMWLRANEFHPKYRFSRIVASKKAKLGKLKAVQRNKPVADPKISINSLDTFKRGLILKVEVKSKSWGQSEVLKDLCFDIHKNEKILIKGKNGSGKTTLLNIIAGEDKNFVGDITLGENTKIGYVRQFSNLNKTNSVLQEFEAKTGISEPKSRSILARYLFGADKIVSKVGSLSFGELKRLDLAIVLAGWPNLLILDEPTNHLDIYTREELEAFIVEQQVAMIVVSHDRYFIEKIGLAEVVGV